MDPVLAARGLVKSYRRGRAVDGGAFPWHELMVSTLLTVAAGAAAMLYVTSMLRVFRRRGYVTRYS